jgi:NDP-sugar pyrophosphorylase family protein
MVSRSLLRAYPHVALRTDLVDAHVYLFAHWVLDVLEQKPHFSSAKLELLPYLVRKQFLQKSNLPSAHARSGLGAAEQPDAVADGAASAESASALAMSAGKGARRQLTHAADFRCCCYLLPHSGAYCVRASTLRDYLQANLDVSRESRVTLYAKAEVGAAPPAPAFAVNDSPQRGHRWHVHVHLHLSPVTCHLSCWPACTAARLTSRAAASRRCARRAHRVRRSRSDRLSHLSSWPSWPVWLSQVPSEGMVVKEGNFVLKSCDRDSTVGEAVEVGGRSFIKKASIGPHCRIGSGVKITNCVLMDHVVIGDKVTMQNAIIGGNAEVREGASLKDAQVAANVTVEAGAVHKGEAVTREDSMGDDEVDVH